MAGGGSLRRLVGDWALEEVFGGKCTVMRMGGKWNE